ncbi:GNAT family N-acetyltransferase [Sphingomonas quercus]|uniref:GNAT family N-acetyltransferase n=1 Tax=Sphingomonas quercus TaxID=2842451 RepID=A0ABS6BE31_9SPHN|nr:GNAT family N-acetyltransferase [Sphingomonas quercus]MBU3076565.1 GNAT family N-acetyltransferase [Sphingomonas quercus]
MRWRIRRADERDADALALIGSATFLDAYAGRMPGAGIVAHAAAKNQPATYARWGTAADHALWLVEADEGGAPVGYQVVAPPDMDGFTAAPGDVELKRIYLLSRLYGTGAGQALMDEAIRWAREQGMARLLLALWDENFRALAFYRRQGFAQIGQRRFQVGAQVYDDPVLALDL